MIVEHQRSKLIIHNLVNNCAITVVAIYDLQIVDVL